MDLTIVNSNDTDECVRWLCAKELSALRCDLTKELGLVNTMIRPAIVRVYQPPTVL